VARGRSISAGLAGLAVACASLGSVVLLVMALRISQDNWPAPAEPTHFDQRSSLPAHAGTSPGGLPGRLAGERTARVRVPRSAASGVVQASMSFTEEGQT
jgi:hypothetical protein